MTDVFIILRGLLLKLLYILLSLKQKIFRFKLDRLVLYRILKYKSSHKLYRYKLGVSKNLKRNDCSLVE